MIQRIGIFSHYIENCGKSLKAKPTVRAIYSAPRGEGDADFKIRGPATQKNYGNATAAPPESGRNFGPAFGGAQYSKQNKNKL